LFAYQDRFYADLVAGALISAEAGKKNCWFAASNGTVDKLAVSIAVRMAPRSLPFQRQYCRR
jgi:hypothetical protein